MPSENKLDEFSIRWVSKHIDIPGCSHCEFKNQLQDYIKSEVELGSIKLLKELLENKEIFVKDPHTGHWGVSTALIKAKLAELQSKREVGKS